MSETMTKREQIAAMAMQGVLGNSYWNERGYFDPESVARSSVDYADALIAHLKRTTPRHTEYTLTPNRVEEMLAATIPGGSVADPQEIADAIREWFGYSPNDLERTPCSALDCALAAKYRKAVEVLEAIENRYIDGCDTYEDWKAMGELARGYFLAHSKETPTPEATACYARECVECGDILKLNYPNPICSQCERKQNNQNHDD